MTMTKKVSLADAENACYYFFSENTMKCFKAKAITPMLTGNYFIQTQSDGENGREARLYKFVGDYRKGNVINTGTFNNSRKARNFYNKKVYPNVVRFAGTSDFIDLNKY